MSAQDLGLALGLAACLFVIGLAGMIARRSLVFMLLCAEIMLNAAGFAFIAAGARWGRPEGQVMFIFLLATAAAEVAVGLALILALSGAREGGRQAGRGEPDADELGSGGE
jgi:NADH-quinone oxidoreductase subunit K